MGWDGVEVDPGMALEPLLSCLVFVNIEVVQNDMQLTVGKRNRHLVHEVQEVDRGSPLLDVGQDAAAGNFQGSQQRLGAMANIVPRQNVIGLKPID